MKNSSTKNCPFWSFSLAAYKKRSKYIKKREPLASCLNNWIDPIYDHRKKFPIRVKTDSKSESSLINKYPTKYSSVSFKNESSNPTLIAMRRNPTALEVCQSHEECRRVFINVGGSIHSVLCANMNRIIWKFYSKI